MHTRIPSPFWSAQSRRAISLDAVDKIADNHPKIIPHLNNIKLSGLIFPFKASLYFVNKLIDWSVAPKKVHDNPFYRLVFPTLVMLRDKHHERLVAANATEDPKHLTEVVADIHSNLNPHPAGQKALNGPKTTKGTKEDRARAKKLAKQLTGSVGDDKLQFAQKEAGSHFEYLADHEFDHANPIPRAIPGTPLRSRLFLPHIKNICIGTQSLSFWPQRFKADKDANELVNLMRRVREEGGRHLAEQS
eukprot:jgi/Psemu1/28785/gm1.28785_g